MGDQKINKYHPDPKELPKKSNRQQEQWNNVPAEMWKILTVQIREDIYDLLISLGLFPEK